MTPKVIEQATGMARGVQFSIAMGCTVPVDQQGLQVLMSHLEALAVLPIHRASFPKPFHCPTGRGGLVGPTVFSKLFPGVVC